ncbi:hypothetical protein G6F36_005593 [Rhizopus arrhizus]|nr:hypothetical protein G6F36_005593 [Rhizopus arrhizus]
MCHHLNIAQDKKYCLSERSTHKPTKLEIDLALSQPALCFCKKPAHLVFTHEYGPILECGNYQMEAEDPTLQINYICGFHMHMHSWGKLKAKLMEKKGVRIATDHRELRACPLYNLSFCAMFSVTNIYAKRSLTVPTCFCKRPVILKDQGGTLEFVCMNCDVEGAKPKCSWNLPVAEVAFPRPVTRLHRLVSLEEYLKVKQDKLNYIKPQTVLTPSIDIQRNDSQMIFDSSDSRSSEAVLTNDMFIEEQNSELTK